MASNFVQEGDTIEVTANRAINAGEGMVISSHFGIAQTSAANGAPVRLMLTGVHDITALGSDNVTTLPLAYWDNTNFRITTTASGNRLVGAFVLPKPSGTTVARVRLTGLPV